MSFTIRTLNEGDNAAWRALWFGYLEHYDTDVYGIAAEDAHTGDLVGICHYLFHASTWALAPYCYLEDLFTSRAARGQGVGRELIGYVAEEAKKRESTKLYWQTHETNAVAQVLYNRIANRTGFMVYDINPESSNP